VVGFPVLRASKLEGILVENLKDNQNLSTNACSRHMNRVWVNLRNIGSTHFAAFSISGHNYEPNSGIIRAIDPHVIDNCRVIALKKNFQSIIVGLINHYSERHKYKRKGIMQRLILTSLIVALFSGLAIGVQSTLISMAGKNTGAMLTGILVNVAAGIAAGLLLVFVYLRPGSDGFPAIQAPTFGIIAVAGMLGIGIIGGIAYALPKVGVAAGLSMIITGQMAMGVLVDTFGLADGDPIPLNWARIGGLVLLAVGTWFIVPRN
jgi:transporter family-2 protein